MSSSRSCAASKLRRVPRLGSAPWRVRVRHHRSLGVGKGTLIRGLMERLPELALSVSATTRAPRPGERDGVDYHFLTREAFDRRVPAGEFVEHADYAGRSYGTLRSELRAPRRRGRAGGARDRGAGRPPGARSDARCRAGVHRTALARGAAHAPGRSRHRRRRGGRAPLAGRRAGAHRPARVRSRRRQRQARGRSGAVDGDRRRRVAECLPRERSLYGIPCGATTLQGQPGKAHTQ